MTGCRRAKVFGGHVQIDLRTADQPMPQQIADRHQPYSGAHQVGRERVPQRVRRNTLANAGSTRVRPHPLIDRAPRHRFASAVAKERLARLHVFAGLAIGPQRFSDLGVQRNRPLMTALADHANEYRRPATSAFILPGSPSAGGCRPPRCFRDPPQAIPSALG